MKNQQAVQLDVCVM